MTCGKRVAAKFENTSVELVGAIINRPRALNERPYYIILQHALFIVLISLISLVIQITKKK